jgi:DNA repair protein RadC
MTRSFITMRDLPRCERPREKMTRYGPDALSDAELLAVLLRCGRRGQNVMALAEQILRTADLAHLPQVSIESLKKLKGMGSVKALEILACVEMGRRIFECKKTHISQFLSARDVYEALRDIRIHRKEHFIAFFLDMRNQQIHREVISVGTINASLVHPREVFEPAVKYLAAQIIVAHNHPSGDVEPSDDDISVTKRLVTAGKILGSEVIDHVIVAANAFTSMKEKGCL